MPSAKSGKSLSFSVLRRYIQAMEFSKENIVSRPFSKKFMGGLNEFEVRDFLHVLAEEIKRLSQQNILRQKQIQEQKDLIQDYRDREHILKESIASAEKWAEKIRKDAESNSSLILEKAQNKSENMIQEAGYALQTVYNDISDLKRLHLQYKTGLKAALQVQMDLLDQEPVYSPGLDAKAPKLAMESEGPSVPPQQPPQNISLTADSAFQAGKTAKRATHQDLKASQASILGNDMPLAQASPSFTADGPAQGPYKQPAQNQRAETGSISPLTETAGSSSPKRPATAKASSPENTSFQTAEREISSLRESLKSINKDFTLK